MKTRPRDQGTREETRIVRKAEAHGLKARRLAEGGIYDPGDVEVIDRGGDRWLIECRDRTNMNIHVAVDKARDKAVRSGALFGGVSWMRKVRKDGKKRRVRAGPPIVAVPEDVFFTLLSGRVVRDGT